MKSHTYAFVKERSHTEKMISHTQAFDKRNLSSKERGCLKTKVPETRNGKGKNRNTVKPRLTAAAVIRSPCYYGYFFLDCLAKTAIHSLVKKKPSLMRPNFFSPSVTILRDSPVLPNSEWVMRLPIAIGLGVFPVFHFPVPRPCQFSNLSWF